MPSSSDEESSEGEGEGRHLHGEWQQGVSRGSGSEGEGGVGGVLGKRRSRRGEAGDKEERRRRRKKKKKEREREREKRGGRANDRDVAVAAERLHGEGARTTTVRGWAAPGSLQKEFYFFDSRGDAANLAFDGLYRGDVALYRRHDPAHLADALGHKGGAPRGGRPGAGGELEGSSLRDSRYYCAAAARAERAARLRRWRPPPRLRQHGAEQREGQGEQPGSGGMPPPLPLPPPGVLPLAAGGGEGGVHAGDEGYSGGSSTTTLQDVLLQRTREFNESTRQNPQDLQNWLAFAAFQVPFCSLTSRRAAPPPAQHGTRMPSPCALMLWPLDSMHGARPHPSRPAPAQDEATAVGRARRGTERAAAEKKIVILEKALTHHPGSEELLLALLETVRV